MDFPHRFPNAMCNWPKHMYVNGDESKAIRCLAAGCNQTFTTDAFTEIQVMHYERAFSSSDSDICKNQHGILKQMHTLKVCLVCWNAFPDQADSRVLFNHVIKNHPYEQDMSTIQGFLKHVRIRPDKIPKDSLEAEEYRKETFRLAFEHLKLQLTTGGLSPQFKALMGYSPNHEIPDDKLREVLTKPCDVENFPVLPSSFLTKLEYNKATSLLPENEWYRLKYHIEGLYRKGEI